MYAYRLYEKGEYSACIISAYSELEYLIFSRHTDSWTRDYCLTNQAFRLSQYLKSHLESNNQDAYALFALRNKIVHQRYVATEAEAHDFLHLVETVNEDDCKKQE